jgi:predicted RNA-binding Zn-ribbon protein involved in translation (DUF1610 family)
VFDFSTNLRGPFRNLNDEKLGFGPCDLCGESDNSREVITRVPCETCGRIVCWKCADCGVFASLHDFQSFVHRHKPRGKDVYLLAESCPKCQETTWWRKYGSSRCKRAASSVQQAAIKSSRPKPMFRTRAKLYYRNRIKPLWRKAVNLARDIKYQLTKKSIEFSHISSRSPSELVRYFTRSFERVVL